MVKFFFYGIFLDKSVRERYGITSEPDYQTVRDYATEGDYIVTAHHYSPELGLALTGIVVEVPEDCIPAIDRLEGGYDRVTVKTVQGHQVQMYVGKDWSKYHPSKAKTKSEVTI